MLDHTIFSTELNAYLAFFILKCHTKEVGNLTMKRWLAMNVNSDEFHSPIIIRATKVNY